MPVEQLVRNRNELLVPLGVPRLVSAKEQQRRTLRIEGIQHSQVPVFDLPPQLLHVGVTGADNHVGVRTGQRRSVLFQKIDLGADLDLLIFREGIPPTFELVGEFDLPGRNALFLIGYIPSRAL